MEQAVKLTSRRADAAATRAGSRVGCHAGGHAGNHAGGHAGNRAAWRQPVVWLALLVFVASLAACIAMIVLAVRLADPADAPAAGLTIMKMPVERQPEADRPTR